MGGKIEVSSELDVGTTFEIEIKTVSLLNVKK